MQAEGQEFESPNLHLQSEMSVGVATLTLNQGLVGSIPALGAEFACTTIVCHTMPMANQRPKTGSNTGRNDNRACGKAAKKHPKKNGAGANGKTVGGYTPAKIELRRLKRLGVKLSAEVAAE